MKKDISDEERGQLARTLMRLFDSWGLEGGQRLILLGLPEGTKARALSAYRKGEPLPADSEILQRALYLIEIQNTLETTLPMNGAIVEAWITTENLYLQERRPLDIMLEDGLDGLARVCNSLSGDVDWG